MDDKEIRAEALQASINYYGCCRPGDEDIPRQQIVETAERFADYIKNGD